MLQVKIPLSFTQTLNKMLNNSKLKKFLAKFSNLSINIPLWQSLQKMLGYDKFMKDMVTKNKVMDFEKIELMHNVVLL